ncbi:MAG: ABC transporter ATP-binding protein [bacterium]|nr:ABC transporter ATP-binding protein [bacterium]
MLKVENVGFSIGGTNILNGISFEITAGETVGVIGPNGSGKTTLFNCISGFNFPQAGKVIFKDHEITYLPAFKRARHGLGRVFQNFSIFKEMTVTENIVTALEGKQKLGSTFFPWSKKTKENINTAHEYLKKVGLQSKAKDKAGSLSGGQMRLLEIIRTLAFGADMFLLDEPTAGVSPKMKDDISALIRVLQTEGKTVVVIEHDINFIQKFCGRIIVLDVGQVVLDDTPENVRKNPLLQKVYFGNN